jgi:ABC-type branched-subunit amino acid transport system ATPase component
LYTAGFAVYIGLGVKAEASCSAEQITIDLLNRLMRILFIRKFKSVTALDSIELPDFTVLTGVNGAGKSHLLEALENGSLQVEGVHTNQPNGSRPIRRFDSNSLVPQDTGPFSAAQISQEQTNFWNEISQHREQQLNPYKDSLKQFGIPLLEAMDVKQLLALSTDNLVSLGVPETTAPQLHATIQSGALNANQYVTSMFVRNDPQNRSRLMSTMSSTARLPVFAMDQDDFFGEYPKLWQPVDLFQQSFARLFTAYQRHWSQNKLKSLASKEGEKIEFLTESEFVKKHGTPPWVFLNEILESAELDFRINEPYKWDDRPYEPVLTDSRRDIRIKFNDLSSGERILMSFALCLYHASDPSAEADFPKVLLFDEIDAPLHPSMTRSLIRIIQQVLVDKHQIKVILTTHSPSTVALAPEGSIYVMQKHGHNRLRSTTKDAALGILTSGVPTLSVNYENRRQVFVESKYDAQYYSALFEHAKTWLNPEISISFIASGPSGNGDCQQVKSVVTQLTAGGNRTVLGIIDWDSTNKSEGAILVLGENERYSIENFLLDPVLVGLLLLRERISQPQDIGLELSAKYSHAGDLSEQDLQNIATAVAGSLNPPKLTNHAETVEYIYISGGKVKVPKWLSTTQGHALESAYKKTFPALLRYKNEPDLKNAIIDRVLGDFPQFTPLALIHLFKRVQSIS